MELDESTRADLAGFFARRFPSSEVRADLAESAGLSTVDLDDDARRAWRTLVDRAVARRRLRALVEAADAAAPDDPNLAEVRRLVGGGKRPSPAWSAAAAIAPVVALVGVAVAWVAGGFGGAGEVARGQVSPSATASVTRAAPAATPARSAPPTAATSTASVSSEPAATTTTVADSAIPTATTTGTATAAVPLEAAAVPLEVRVAPVPAPTNASIAVPPSTTAPTPAATPPATPAPTATSTASQPAPSTSATTAPAPRATSRAPRGCDVPAGTLVGWWYTSGAKPGNVGDVVTVPSHVNVRADYPNAKNGYARGGEVRCTLRAGTRQRLSEPPVGNGAGSWWVPVIGGDLGG